MYKFISYEDWIAKVDGVRTCPSYYVHPNARVNYEKTEVVVSCNCGDGTYTHAQALARIGTWVKAPEGEV